MTKINYDLSVNVSYHKFSVIDDLIVAVHP
jgi:hypothetical protein